MTNPNPLGAGLDDSSCGKHEGRHRWDIETETGLCIGLFWCQAEPVRRGKEGEEAVDSEW